MIRITTFAAGLLAAVTVTASVPVPITLLAALQEVKRPTITRAVDIVTDSSPKQVSSGDNVVFMVRAGAEGVMRDGFQVRIFTLPGAGTLPVEAGNPIDDCIVFFSTVYPVGASDSPRIQLITDAAEGWLTMQKDGRVSNGYYLLVFERTGVKESVFRIKRSDAAEYFATGIRLVVKATPQSRAQEVKAITVVREQMRSVDVGKLSKTDDRVPCYRYEKVTKWAGLADAPQLLAMLPCPVG